jgi:hypothetical protein
VQYCSDLIPPAAYPEGMAPDPAFPTEKDNEQANLLKLVDAIDEERRDNRKAVEEEELNDTKAG